MLKDLILNEVSCCGGLKITELISRVSIKLKEQHQEVGNISDQIAKLVCEDELIEIEYVLPNFKHKIKSFLLPAGSQVSMTIGK